MAHCIIPAAVLSLASLGSNSPGSYTGSSGSESKLQNSLNELILDLQGSLTHSEVTFGTVCNMQVDNTAKLLEKCLYELYISPSR